MAVNPRNKGQFLQPGMFCFYPAKNSAVISHDGTIECDQVYLQADYPELFEVLGTDWNVPGDNNATHFRTPLPPTWATDNDVICRIRF